MSFGKLICVFIFRNISATFPSGVFHDSPYNIVVDIPAA